MNAKDLAIPWIIVALLLAISFTVFGILRAHGGERMICQLGSKGDGWHYRTRVGGRVERCWYLGARMKPRSELYWAEVPAVAPGDEPAWHLIERWKGEYQKGGAAPGWQHKE